MTERSFIISLIKSVEKNRCIWDPLSQTYAKRDKLEKAWQKIADEYDKPVGFCRDKWKNVRTGFLRSLREYPENSSVGLSKRKPFYLHENMRFLLPYVLRNEAVAAVAAATNLLNSTIESNEQKIVKLEDTSDSSDILDFEELNNFGNTDTVEQKMESVGYFSQFGPSSSLRSEIVETDEPPNKKNKFTNDDVQFRETKEELTLMSFFRGIASDVLSLSIQNQRLFKRKIVEIVDDLHNEETQINEIVK